MKLETNIESVKAEIHDNKLVLKSKSPLKILSSAVLNGGTPEANCIVNVQVDESAGSDVRRLRNASVPPVEAPIATILLDVFLTEVFLI